MTNKDNETSTDTVTSESKTIALHENNSTMLSTVPLSNSTGEEQSKQNTNNDQNNILFEKDSQDNQLIEVQKEEQQLDEQQQETEGEDDEFIRITAAHQMLTEAQTYDEQKKYPAALHLYRICVDLLLEELMFTEGTEQSRVYLREKCTAIMDRIDLLKTMLDPIPPASSPPPLSPPPPQLTETETTTTTTNEEATNPPTEELSSLNLS
ncbi:unnamed protein product [Rotaria sp. Silwood1]|nr:unnamed protein product [Rotaria sp. Silwood1]CAF0956923.1 unnamed protein product [Rotaria sp. Silwood1]CAF3355875.1 unnamed protein product [Rotaria sp. Silwood1]CAF3421589.1 unnamed protein product [Rotaria sp. Silwood1]CAF4628855.1 unnamed protein product [Rotaria sp. Silwood1]